MISVRASARETAMALPGDELVARPIGVFTHAITIEAPAEQVWPWLVQMGAGNRAGWYSYDRLDNGGRRSTWRIRGDLQQVAVGDLFPALPGAREAFLVVRVEPVRTLVLGVRAPRGGYLARWTFVLERATGDNTRLVVRGSFAYTRWHLPRPAMRLLGRAVHFVMERRQLLGIKRRVEDGRLWLPLAESPGLEDA